MGEGRERRRETLFLSLGACAWEVHGAEFLSTRVTFGLNTFPRGGGTWDGGRAGSVAGISSPWSRFWASPAGGRQAGD